MELRDYEFVLALLKVALDHLDARGQEATLAAISVCDAINHLETMVANPACGAA